MQKQHYLYLIHNKDYSMSKVGYTYSTNPLIRVKQYITHNPEININLNNIFKIPDKLFEKLVYLGLLKQYKPVSRKGQKEWFEGHIKKDEVVILINDLKSRETYKKINS